MAGWLAAVCLLAGCGRSDEPAPVHSPAVAPKLVADVVANPVAPAVPLLKGKFAPQDECRRLTNAGPFRASLRSVIKRRDAAAFASMAAPDVLLDFGGGEGRAELSKRLSDTDGPLLWEELDKILALGCASLEGGMMIPWMAAQDFGDEVFDVMLVTGTEVPLLDIDLKSPLRRLSWDTVKTQSGIDYDKPYRKTRASDGTYGFVKTEYLRSPADYRLFAKRDGETWQITVFVAGD